MALTLPEQPAGATEVHEKGAILEDQYEIKRILGEGGTAITYLAYDRMAETEYVLKVIRDIEHAHRLAQSEFKALKDLSHDNLPKVFDVRAPGQPFHLKIEYIRGEHVTIAL